VIGRKGRGWRRRNGGLGRRVPSEELRRADLRVELHTLDECVGPGSGVDRRVEEAILRREAGWWRGPWQARIASVVKSGTLARARDISVDRILTRGFVDLNRCSPT